ncbi:hypothetical protein V8C37DRAFT_365185 [Trichoderma ceciliae]
MPARTRKRKVSEEAETTPEIVPVVKKTSRAPRKSQKGSQEQPSKAEKPSKKGRGNPSGLNIAKVSKKTRSAASTASTVKRDIRRKADDLIHLIESQSKDGLGTAVASTIDSSIAAILKDTTNLMPQSAGERQSIIYQKSCEWLQDLQRTMDEYDGLNRTGIDMTKPTEGKQWVQDANDAAKVNKRAMDISLQTLSGIVLPGESVNFSPSLTRSGDEVEQAARRWLEGGIPGAEDTWGAFARETMKVFAGVIKLL